LVVGLFNGYSSFSSSSSIFVGSSTAVSVVGFCLGGSFLDGTSSTFSS